MTYDAVVVGARCAGAPTAMLLARRGLRVLLVDRAAFPSDILKGHVIKPAGVARLARWGVLDDLLATGCPPIRRRRMRFGDSSDVAVDMAPGVQMLIARRHVLDWVLVQAAAAAGAEVRDRCTLTDLVWQDGRITGVELRGTDRRRWRERSRVVIGADGVRSRVARLAGSDVTAAWPAASAAYWSYWSGVTWDPPTAEMRCHGWLTGGSPTHGGESLMFVQIPLAHAGVFRADTVGEYQRAMTAFAGDRLLGAERTSRVFGITDLPNYFRRSHGPGSVLAGDAGHHKDPLAARGITDAFRDADLVADAIVAGLDGGDLDDRLAAYEVARDMASYEVAEPTALLARLNRPVDALMQDWAALAAAEAQADEVQNFAGRNT